MTIGKKRERATARRPRVGLTTYYREAAWGDWSKPAALVPSTYLERVAEAGGVPLLVPPVGSDDTVLEVLDALIVIGGADVEAHTYGAAPHPRTAGEPLRDEHEIALVRAALQQGLPLLAICRGAQVLNVALGGTLTQHLPDVIGHEDYQPQPGVYGGVVFATEPGSRAAAVLGSTAWAPCYHHQAVDRVADGLRVTARSSDGVVQALEPEPGRAERDRDDRGRSAAGWALGVQFHPEENPDDLRLFTALIRAAQAYRGRTVHPDRPSLSSEIAL